MNPDSERFGKDADIDLSLPKSACFQRCHKRLKPPKQTRGKSDLSFQANPSHGGAAKKLELLQQVHRAAHGSSIFCRAPMRRQLTGVMEFKGMRGDVQIILVGHIAHAH